MNAHIRRRELSLLVICVVIGAIFISPARAHVGDAVAHLWAKHIKPKVTKLVYTEAEADARFLGIEGKAADADTLDGEDSDAYAPAQAEAWLEIEAAGRFNDGNSLAGEHTWCWWSNYGDGAHNTAAIYKDPFGRVHLKGLVKANDGVPTEGEVRPCGARYDNRDIFYLPYGYRPARTEVFTTMGNKKLMMVKVLPHGVVELGNEPEFTTNGTYDDVQVYLSLDGISYRANS